MLWKIPISSGLFDDFGDDDLARDLFIHLILKSQGYDMLHPKKIGGYFYQLKKGQVLFACRPFGKRLRASGQAISKCLNRLIHKYHLVDAVVDAGKSRRCSVISLKGYDELIGMKPGLYAGGTREGRDGDNPKNDKKEKTDKKDTIPPFPLTDESKDYAKSLGFTDADLEEFTSYWTEGEEQGKARWKKEKAFDVKRRLRWRAGKFDEWGHAKPPRDSQLFIPRLS